VLEKLGILIYY